MEELTELTWFFTIYHHQQLGFLIVWHSLTSADEDIPLHFIFGIQLEGTLELRPKKLAQIYLRRLVVDTPGLGRIRTGKSERSERDDGIWEIYREYVSEDTFFSGTLSTNPKFWGRNGPHGDQSSEWWKWPSSYELVIPKKLCILWVYHGHIYPITECVILNFPVQN